MMHQELGNLVVIQFLFFAAGWAIFAATNAKHRPSTILWATFNLLQAAAIFTFLRIGSWGPPTGLVSMLCAQFGSSALYLGLEYFLTGQFRHWRLWIGLPVLGIALLLNPGKLIPADYALVCAGNLPTILFGIAAIMICWPYLNEEFGKPGWLALSPTIGQLAYVFWRLTSLILYPENSSYYAAFLQPKFVFFLFALSACSALNMVFMSLLLTRLFQKLKEQASRDELTKVFNRATFNAHLHHACFRYKRNPHPLTLAFIDIDHFKRINDTGGHASGDLALRELAARIGSCVRASDLVGRWGGEEFVILLSDTGTFQAAQLIDRLQQSIRSNPIPVPPGLPPLTLSIGIATVESEADADVNKLMQRADEAMYKAKNDGRDRIIVANPCGSSLAFA